MWFNQFSWGSRSKLMSTITRIMCNQNFNSVFYHLLCISSTQINNSPVFSNNYYHHDLSLVLSIVSSPPSCRKIVLKICNVGKKERLVLFEFLGGGGVKRGEWIFSGQGAKDFLKVFFNCWSNITEYKKNVNYINNHNHNVLYLLTIFKCLQLVT